MKVNISPGVGIIKIFKALDYESWFAFAEYIDNSISSYLTDKMKISKYESNPSLVIKININHIDGSITISDNAGGISSDKYEYAFRAAEIPDDTTGLNEFGMGMKTASSWLANKWTVITSAIDEYKERTIEFNVNEVVKNDTHELDAKEVDVDASGHYTIIRLEQLTNNAPLKKDLNKIRKHLASIHRKFIRRDDISIYVNDEELKFENQPILSAPKWDDLSGREVEWKVTIDQKFGSNKRVRGFIGLLSTMSTSVHNGFSLFRRGRVIEGSGDDLFRPRQLSGQVGSHQYKRVFGELELDGFQVDFTKGKFQGDRDFDELLDLLQDFADSVELPLLRQAKNYRKPQPKESLKDIATKGAKDWNDSIPKIELQKSIEEVVSNSISRERENPTPKAVPEANKLEVIIEEFDIHEEKWIVELTLIDSEENLDWLEITEEDDLSIGVKKIKAKLSLIHPFMTSFGTEDIQPFIRLALALTLAESLARVSGGGAGMVRRNLNDLLKTILSR